MKPLLILSYLWTDVILDFIIGLSINNSYNTIFIVVNYWIKKRYYMSYNINENGTIIETIT